MFYVTVWLCVLKLMYVCVCFCIAQHRGRGRDYFSAPPSTPTVPKSQGHTQAHTQGNVRLNHPHSPWAPLTKGKRTARHLFSDDEAQRRRRGEENRDGEWWGEMKQKKVQQCDVHALVTSCAGMVFKYPSARPARKRFISTCILPYTQVQCVCACCIHARRNQKQKSARYKTSYILPRSHYFTSLFSNFLPLFKWHF